MFTLFRTDVLRAGILFPVSKRCTQTCSKCRKRTEIMMTVCGVVQKQGSFGTGTVMALLGQRESASSALINGAN